MSLLLTRVLDPRPILGALVEATKSIKRHRMLILEMTRRELLDRYAGNALSGFWTIATPLLQLGTNVFAFMYIMRIRLDVHDSGLQYTLFVLSGMIAWLGVSEALGRGSTVIVGNASLVKQIVFPTEVLPLKVALASLAGLGVGIVIVLILALLNGHYTFFGIFILLPLACVFYILIVSGFVYALATLGVFFRDIHDVTGVLLSIGLFLHPIFYAPSSVPAWLEHAFAFSPFSHLIWCFRDALFYGEIIHPWSWIIAPACGILFFALGWRIFRTLRPTFGNAL